MCLCIGEMKQQNSNLYSTGFDFNNTTFHWFIFWIVSLGLVFINLVFHGLVSFSSDITDQFFVLWIVWKTGDNNGWGICDFVN